MLRVSSLAHYEDIFDRSPDPALIIDLEKNRILDASFSAERIFGNEEQECLNGKSLDEFIENDEFKIYKRNIRILKSKFYPRAFEVKVKDMKGKSWDAEIIGHAIELTDGRSVAQLFIKDITQRKLHEEIQALSLENAKMVVNHMLPGSIPKPDGYEISVFYEACSAVGGDFYDFIAINDEHLGLCLGDARGHGLEAALVMGMVRKALSLCAAGNLDPAHVLCAANKVIAPDLNKGNFATCFYGILNHHRHHMDFCCAGHNHSMVLKANEERVQFIEGKGLPVGFMVKVGLFEKSLTTMTFDFEPGDIFVQYTDGIVETENKKGEMYEFDRFCDILLKLRYDHTQEICDGIIEDVRKFQRKQAQRDDISLMVVRREGNS